MNANPRADKASGPVDRVGVAFGGGGARGLAHIGVLKVLERAGVSVKYISGTSIGGVIGAGYAAGFSPQQLEQEAKSATHMRQLLGLFDPGFPNAGLLRGQRLEQFFGERLGQRTFADLERPLALVAVDLNTRRQVILREGSVALALRASISVPGLFMPVEHDGRRMVDGGLLNNLPIDAVRELGADVVVAVDVEPGPADPGRRLFANNRWVPSGLVRTFATMDEAVSLMMAQALEERLQRYPPDIYIQPQIPAGINIFGGYERVDELIDAGERAMQAALPKLLECLGLPRS